MSDPIRVLILEDDMMDARLMLRQLSQDRLDVEHSIVDNVDDFLAHLDRGTIDVVIVDYSLPTITAPCAIRMIQDRELDVPFIVISGTVGEETAVDTMKLGATDYVMKDRLSRLGPAIQRALRERTVRRERDLARSELEVERALRESQEQFRQLADSIRDVYWLIDLDTDRAAYVSAAFESVWRTSTSELERNAWTWVDRVHDDDRGMVLAAIDDLRNGTPWDIDFRITVDEPEAETRWIHSRGFPVTDRTDRVYRLVAVSEDITDQRRVDEAADQERQRVGRELHDSVSQELAGVSMLATAAVRVLNESGHAAAATVERVGEGIDGALQGIRRLVRGLLPVEMDAEGLEAALLVLCDSTQRSFDVVCRFECPTPVHLEDNRQATYLFRIAQEAVSNSLRHGSPDQIDVSLTQIECTDGDVELRLTVSDDGSGIQSDVRTGGRGLRIMRYRARSIGGAFSLDSTGHGTTVSVSLRRGRRS